MSGWKPILYLITPDYIGEGFFRLVEDALDGGPDVLQYRDKKSTRQTRTEVARRLRRMCHDRGVAFVVDDDPYVARDSGADLLHVGRDDPSIEEAREVVATCPLAPLRTAAPASRGTWRGAGRHMWHSGPSSGAPPRSQRQPL
ncbi:thiamine phosphate synthase [Thermogymnomonas acidicola]|uniref:thiamine phosphate synthase n=1 Tax=Thermogymnomonas acidicola TaxID=399579 RepID=UPI000946373F|nr:thiamine phosphate synthase [Thermogymnomonas acidicola]